MTSLNLTVHAKQHHHVAKMRKRIRVLKGSKPNRKLELWYKVELLKVVRFIKQRTEAELLPLLRDTEAVWSKKVQGDALMVGDGIWDDINKKINDLAGSFGGIRDTAQRLAALAAQRSKESVDASLAAAIRDSVKIDISGALGSGSIGQVMEKAMVQNVELITSIPDQYLNKVRQTVFEGVGKGERYEIVAERIQHVADVTESRAKLIARDQVSKMNGSFNEARQTSIGIDKYVWSTSHDERVRDSHSENDGKVFSWSDPPETGHPGEDIQCRCVALPYFDLDAEEKSLGITE
jgi:SPP1 gp7 family putative phage head morphogenesis protein